MSDEERKSISVEEMDSICRAMKASVEMVEGPATAEFSFPMYSLDRECECSVRVMAFRCSNPDCDGGVHVNIEITPFTTSYSWSQERSDNHLFGFPTTEEES